MFFVRLNGDGVTCRHFPQRFAPLLNESAPLFDEKELRRTMPVPVRSGAWLELDQINNDRL
jgi:hypothetical protein